MGDLLRSRRVMIIGASEFQMPGIVKAKAMGAYVVATDRREDAPGMRVADAGVYVGSDETERLLEVAREYQVDAVMTTTSDLAVPGVAAVCEALGLPGPTREAARMGRDKGYMRERLREMGLPSPRFRTVESFKAFAAAAGEMGFPFILKPVDGASSRGVKKVLEETDLKEAYEESLSWSEQSRLLLEDFMEGKEVSVEALTCGNRTRVVTITDKLITPPPYTVELGHTQPSELPEETQQTIRKLVEDALNALKIGSCATHAELIVTKDGPKFCEINMRLGGDYITQDLAPLSTGVDMFAETVKIACGIEPSATPVISRGAVIRYFAPPAGRLVKIEGVDEAGKIPGVERIEMSVREGDRIKPVHYSGDRAGYVIASGANREEAVRAAEEAMAAIRFTVEEE